jgi:AraC-like DNA-binding protein
MTGLFDKPPNCPDCQDTGWARHPKGGVIRCRRCQPLPENSHPEASGFKSMKSLASESLKEIGGMRYEGASGQLRTDEQKLLDLIRPHSYEHPIKIKDLMAATGYDERRIKDLCRTLRDYHLFPIGASRQEPAGIFWITTAEAFLKYFHTIRAQALSELSTLHRMARKHFPELAGQLKLEF